MSTNYTRPRGPNASHPDAREPDARQHTAGEDDTSDLVVKTLDHSAIWSRYNGKAGAIQRIVPENLEGDD